MARQRTKERIFSNENRAQAITSLNKATQEDHTDAARFDYFGRSGGFGGFGGFGGTVLMNMVVCLKSQKPTRFTTLAGLAVLAVWAARSRWVKPKWRCTSSVKTHTFYYFGGFDGFGGLGGTVPKGKPKWRCTSSVKTHVVLLWRIWRYCGCAWARLAVLAVCSAV